MQMKHCLAILLLLGASAVMTGCASISEEDCLSGNWAERGFKDGSAGKSRSLLSEYEKRCAKFSASVDRTAYLREYETGLGRYCIYDNGFSRGRSGSSYNAVCTGALADGYAQGYDDGKVIYQIHHDHEQLIADYNGTLDDIIVMEDKLAILEISDDERRRIKKKILRLQDRREGLRRDIRRHEREFDLPRYDFD